MESCATRVLVAAASGLLLAPPAHWITPPCSLAAIPQRIANPGDLGAASVSANGRFVAFASRARLLAAASDSRSGIYVLDLVTQALTLESPRAVDGDVSGDGRAPSISGDGRFLVFEWTGPSDPGTATAHVQICLRDRLLDTTRVVSVNGSGVPVDASSSNPVISADGRVIAFDSTATNLVAGLTVNGRSRDVYVVDRAAGAIARASLDAGGLPRAGSSFSPAISADGRFVAFTSDATLDEASTPVHAPMQGARAPTRQVFVRDLVRGTTRRVSRRPDGRAPNGASFFPSISGDGRWVAFVSTASDIAAGGIRNVSNVYLHDLDAALTTLVSRSGETAGSDGPSTRPALSASGRFVAFESNASNLHCGKHCLLAERDINLVSDVFVFDREERTMTRLSADADSGWTEPSLSPALDANGRVVVFSSRHPIAVDDTGNDFDIFVRSCRQ